MHTVAELDEKLYDPQILENYNLKHHDYDLKLAYGLYN